MAQITVNAQITAPSTITIPLVRADIAESENIFRIFFEVSLSFFSAYLGYSLTLSKIEFYHIVVLIFSGLIGLGSLIASMLINKKAKVE